VIHARGNTFLEETTFEFNRVAGARGSRDLIGAYVKLNNERIARIAVLSILGLARSRKSTLL